MECCLPLSVQANLPRVFAHDAYAKVREAQLVSIVFLEALALAAFFPVLWHLDDGVMRLVALRSVGAAAPPNAEATLPLILRAFPIRNRNENDWDELIPCLDTTPPDRAANVGAAVFTADGQLSVGLQHRVRSLILYGRNVAATRNLTEALQEFDMLMPWDLKERAAKIADVPDGLFVARDPAAIAHMPRFLALFRQKGANLLTAHRLSMYRTGNLLARGRASPTETDPVV